MVGYGNIGRGVHKAIEENGKLYGDVAVAGIITRRPEQVMSEVAGIQVVSFDKADDLNPDVLILCGGSATDLPEQGPQFVKAFNTVDSFDTHAKLPDYFKKMDKTAKSNGNVAVIATGWDPGTFSLERVLADAFIPGVKPYGFYGLSEKGGLSMGHSDAIRRVTGVKDARQYTHAIPEAMNDVRSGKNPIRRQPCLIPLMPPLSAVMPCWAGGWSSCSRKTVIAPPLTRCCWPPRFRQKRAKRCWMPVPAPVRRPWPWRCGFRACT